MTEGVDKGGESDQSTVPVFRLSVACPQTASDPENVGRTIRVEGLYVLGELPAHSALEAVNLYWRHCPHIKPGLLDRSGVPLAKARLKRKDIQAQAVTAGEMKDEKP